MDLQKLAFLGTYETEDATIMGVIMITDSDTKPIEFRVTSPIKPTNFQKILYGNVLDEHILVELIALPLLKAVSSDIDIILVNNPAFLGANKKQECRLINVFSDDTSAETSANKIVLDSITTNGHSTFISTSSEHIEELNSISSDLNKISSVRDLLEPFSRLKQACEQVYLKKTKE